MRSTRHPRRTLQPLSTTLIVASLAANAIADFDYPDFSSTAGLTLVGAAAQSGNALRLVPALNGQAGAVWIQTQQQVVNGFETVFTFQLGANAGADGFAFLVQNSAPAPIGGTGCQLGYHGIADSLAVEFDTYSNGSCAGTPANEPGWIHVSVHSLGTAPNSASESASLGNSIAVPDFADGQVHTGRVRYFGGLLSVYVDNLTLPAMSISVNLGQLLSLNQGRAWVGFTASTGGLFEVHDMLAWNFDETPTPSNVPPLAPVITEPASAGLTLNPADVHMETAPFSDGNTGDQHYCTDWEIWTVAPSQRVWYASCETGVEKVHTHLGDGIFENALFGHTELFANTNYDLRVRHADDSGDPVTQWSAWSTRGFHTGAASQTYPLETDDVVSAPAPRWVIDSSGSDVILAASATPSRLRLESGAGALLLQIEANNGVTNTITNPASLPSHVPVRVKLQAGSNGLALSPTNLLVRDDHCELHEILLPAVSLVPGATNYYWISTAGATFAGNASQSSPVFTTLARGLALPWDARQNGFEVDVFASGFQLPVNIAFVPNPLPGANDPFCYVTELYGTIKVITRNRTVGTYASGLLNFPPTGAFPGSGEQGLSGIAVDPVNGDVFAAMLYDSAAQPGTHFPKIVRFSSTNGGHTASSQTTILNMAGEPQGQSHQISNLTIAPDGTLLCHMGDGFDTATAQNLNSFRGKILRMNRDGSPVTSNPFYNASDGITSKDYVFAYGVRNPFGGDWRFADGKQYVVENGPSVDRFSHVEPGRNFLWDGSDQSMTNFALYNWDPAHGPVNLVFIQPEVFGGSGFPASSMGHAFVAESGPTYASGLQNEGKRITEWILGPTGNLVAGPLPFFEYAGTGKATACALEAGPDGLYMSELYADGASNPMTAGARILRIYFDTSHDCNGNGADDACDIASGASADANLNGSPDECECVGVNFCQALSNSTGLAAHISANGACSVAANAFVLSAAHVPNTTGVFLYGANQVNGGAGVPFYDGFRCVGTGPIHRLRPAVVANNVVTYAVDFTALPATAAITAGSTWHFQYWFRDPAAGASGANLSDALTVTFQ